MTKSGKLLVGAAMAYAARKMTSLKVNRPFSDNGKSMMKIYGNKNLYFAMRAHSGNNRSEQKSDVQSKVNVRHTEPDAYRDITPQLRRPAKK